MKRAHQFRNRPVLPGLALVGLAAGAASVGPKLPKDPCALLKPAAIQTALDPNNNMAVEFRIPACFLLVSAVHTRGDPELTNGGNPLSQSPLSTH